MFFGWLLLIIGLIFLLKHLGIFYGSAWGIIWPSLLIVWGLVVLARWKKGGCWCCCTDKEEKRVEVK
jgi:hypothetical protein